MTNDNERNREWIWNSVPGHNIVTNIPHSEEMRGVEDCEVFPGNQGLTIQVITC